MNEDTVMTLIWGTLAVGLGIAALAGFLSALDRCYKDRKGWDFPNRHE